MNAEASHDVVRRAAVHAALGEPARLQIVDLLTLGDLAPSELATRLGMPSNLLAHHLNVLAEQGIVTKGRSEGDRRRSYLRLMPTSLEGVLPGARLRAQRVLFVCTANSARSHLAAALWRRASTIPVASAGTHPAQRINPGAIAVAHRHGLPLPRLTPRPIEAVRADGDLVITVCDVAHEELSDSAALHWSVADPVPQDTATAFEDAFAELDRRVGRLAARIQPLPA